MLGLAERTQPGSHLTAITGVNLWDGLSDRVAGPVTVLIDGSRIQAVGPDGKVAIPSTARVVAGSGATVIPGLIDSHVHLTTNSTRVPMASAEYRTTASPSRKLLDGLRNAEMALASGVTTLRVIGHRDAGECELRDFIHAGLILGPTLLVAPWWISMTAGHGDLFFPPQWPRRQWDTADGPDECRKLVRLQVRAGADFIKVMASGGLLSHGDRPEWPNYSVAELTTIVDESHALGLKVAAHAHGIEGMSRAIEAGVDSIEHGTFGDEATFEKMAQKGIVLVPTLSITDHAARDGNERGLTADQCDAMKVARDRHFSSFQRAIGIGVQVAMGTDSSGTICPFGQHAHELMLYESLGLSSSDALAAATSGAARLLDRADQIGQLRPGHTADLLVVAKNPLESVRVLTEPGSILAVMKAGRFVNPFPDRTQGGDALAAS